MSKEINFSNIKSFIQGYSRYYFEKIHSLPQHIKEQTAFRIHTCKDTCLKDGGVCQKCGCPTIQKSYANKSCNLDLFPDMMSSLEWEKFKLDNDILNISDIQAEVDKLIIERNQF
jgi:hypothetical protein